MADAGVDFDAYVDDRFHWHKRLMLVLCACVASENQALVSRETRELLERDITDF